MSDFLGRLAHRGVLPDARDGGAQPIQPRLPGRFESVVDWPADGGGAEPLRSEENVEVVAPPPASDRPPPPVVREGMPHVEPAAVPSPRHPPFSSLDEPAPAAPTPGSHTMELAPRVAVKRIAAEEPEEGGPLGRVTPSVMVPSIVAAPREPDTGAVEAPADMASVAPIDTAVAPPSRLEPVIEIPRVPGRIVVVEPPRPDRRDAARATGRQSAARREIVFEPREQLARLGLEPLSERDLLSVPSMASAIEQDSEVHVHIGRVEVNRPAPAIPSPAPPKGSPVLSLDEYLEQRSAAESGRGRSR